MIQPAALRPGDLVTLAQAVDLWRCRGDWMDVSAVFYQARTVGVGAAALFLADMSHLSTSGWPGDRWSLVIGPDGRLGVVRADQLRLEATGAR